MGVNSPAILYMFGIISSSPWEAVKVVVRAPACKAAVNSSGRTSLALHLDHIGHRAENVRAPLGRPGIRQLAHGRGRRDRINRDHFVGLMRHMAAASFPSTVTNVC